MFIRVFLCFFFFAAGLGLGLWILARGPESASPAAFDPPEGPWDSTLGSAPRFVDVAREAGIPFRHENGRTGEFRYLEIMGGGVGIFDHDGDGDLDIYLVNGNYLDRDASPEITNRLYRNDGGWKFRDVTGEAGVGDAGYGQGCCVGDYDNDGDEDLYISNYGPNVLYRNEGGTFTDVTAAAGVGDPGWGQTCSFLDYDRDGRLDLYAQNYLSVDPGQDKGSWIYVGREKVRDYPSPMGFRGSADRLYRNRGNGTFVDVTQRVGLMRPDGKGMGVACVDLNDDGWVDIFVANDTEANYLFLNREGKVFEEVGLTAGVAFNDSGVPEASMGVDVGDFDRDGRFDLIVPCLRRQFFTLYRNSGGHFLDSSVESGLAAATSRSTGFSVNFIDYDNDADLDLFFANGGVRRNEAASADDSYTERYGLRDVLVANDGTGRYADVSDRAGPYFREALIGRGSAVGDLDGDGDLDIVVSNLADRAVVLRNDTAGGHWITLDLVAEGGRGHVLGTSVTVEAGGLRQRSAVHGGVTYLSQNDRRIHFGLGSRERIDRLEIRWQDGTTRVLEDLPADRVLRIERGKEGEAK